MADFDAAFQYALPNEGRYSNHKADRGGETWYGISSSAREHHKNTCRQHADLQVSDFAGDDGVDLARHIYETDYWKFDGVRDQRVANKLFDIIINVGNPWRLVQAAAGARTDGVYGAKTEAAINAIEPEAMIERLSLAVADRYVAIAVGEVERKLLALGMREEQLGKLQIVNLRGWIRRAVRRPPLNA